MQLQGPMSEELAYNPDQLAICGPNERYSPPIVIFKDGVSATLLFRVDETTSRSQFLAHYAFPSVNHPDTGIGNKGGTQIGGDPTSGTCHYLHIVKDWVCEIWVSGLEVPWRNGLKGKLNKALTSFFDNFFLHI